MYSSTVSLTLALDGGGWSKTMPWLLYPLGRPGTHCIGGWVGITAIDGRGKFHHHQDLIPRVHSEWYTGYAIQAKKENKPHRSKHIKKPNFTVLCKIVGIQEIFKPATFYMTTSALQQIGINICHHKKSYHSTLLNGEKFHLQKCYEVLINTFANYSVLYKLLII